MNPRVIVGSIVDQLNVEGNAVSLTVTASEPGATLTFSATGLFIDPASGVISGTISESALTTVPYAVTATVATFTNSDPNWSAWQFSATINWGDGTSNAGTVNGGNGAFTVSGNHVYARAGNYATSVAIADGFQTATSAGSVAVSAAPIVVSGGFVQGAAAGIEVSATLASFTGNASALASTFTATINWGDTTSSVGTVSGVNGKFVVNGRHTYASTGTYTVNVTVTDLDASTGSATSTAQVGDLVAGIPAKLTVATFRSNDPNATASQFSATIVWGDGTSSNTSDTPTTVTITALAGGVYNVQGTHKYAADGAYTVTTTVYGPYSESITASRSVTVKAPSLTGYAENIAAKVGVALSNVVVAEFIDPNQADTSGMFSALINWGDGASSTGTVSGANGVFEVKGDHQYATAGSYVVQVLVNLRDTARSLANTVATGLVDQKKDQPAPTPFTKILRSKLDPNNPSRWDLNKDGKITMAEIDEIMTWNGSDPKKPEVTGNEAAALAELKGVFGTLLSFAPQWRLDQGVTIKAIAEYESADADTWLTDAAKFVKRTESDFADRKSQLAKVMKNGDILTGVKPSTMGDRLIYQVPTGRIIDTSTIVQGDIGDCTLLATIIGMIKTSFDGGRNPPRIWISQLKTSKDSFNVRFSGMNAAGVDVTRPTQSQIALGASADGSGMWLSIVEKGYAAIRKQNYDHFFASYFSKDDYKVLEGESLEHAMRSVTGRAPKLLKGKTFTKDAIAAALKGVAGRVIVTAATKPSDQDPNDKSLLMSGHAFAIIGYNADTQTLQIQNPWNKPDYVYGKTFSMRIEDFVKQFGAICIENRVGINAQP